MALAASFYCVAASQTQSAAARCLWPKFEGQACRWCCRRRRRDEGGPVRRVKRRKERQGRLGGAAYGNGSQPLRRQGRDRWAGICFGRVEYRTSKLADLQRLAGWTWLRAALCLAGRRMWCIVAEHLPARTLVQSSALSGCSHQPSAYSRGNATRPAARNSSSQPASQPGRLFLDMSRCDAAVTAKLQLHSRALAPCRCDALTGISASASVAAPATPAPRVRF